MKVLFVVQGEGRGHLTQALALEKMLRDSGHEVVGILVGRSKARQVPRFFMDQAGAPVQGFPSPNFLPSKENQRVGVGMSVAYNIMKVPQYMAAMHFLYRQIKKSGADLVINFYEILTGLTNYFLRPQVPMVCIGHQYLFLHPEYEFPEEHKASQKMMLAFTRATCLGARRLLALSFRQLADDDAQGISVVPPLLRQEALDMPRHHGDYITGYILNAGFSESVMEWHRQNPEYRMHFFWDKQGVDATTCIDETLSFHRIDDLMFLYYLANCRAYATTGGFESVCEAMYMGKPVMMVPAHVEQECNAYEVCKYGAGVVGETFDLGRLLAFRHEYEEDVEFRMWVNKAEMMVVSRLESVLEQVEQNRRPESFTVGTTISAR